MCTLEWAVILGAYIEFYLQVMGVDCLLSYRFGMSKTLLSAEWACWEEPGDKVTIHGHEAVVCQPKFL